MNKYYTILIIGGITFGTAAIFIKLSNLTPGMIAFSRFFVAGLILSRGKLPLRRILKQWKVGALLAAHMILFVLSVYHTTVIDSTVLVSTSPLFSLVLAPLVGIGTTRREAIAGITAFLGVLIMNFPLNQGYLLGNILAILSALTVSLYTVLLSKTDNQDPLLLTSYVYIMSALFSFPIAILQGVGQVNLISVLSLLGLIMLPTLIGHTSVIYSSGHVKPQHIEVIGLLEPVVATILAYLIFSQAPTTLEVVGGAIIILSIIMIILK
ncbi:EamA family transporter [Metallosphaera hakonensis JCM 8857 = DSM 7519]|uniref:Permease n=1 Tax=Metallosphaera hakonensis JCM 8857 = DSM 7519 TaxID=1293036 RepID=A0A2U9IXH5_9CREN|nr:EamA family transporter [Metallosphaera hakonensis JCM 8857 = DSM 7519]